MGPSPPGFATGLIVGDDQGVVIEHGTLKSGVWAHVLAHLLAHEAGELNIGFVSRMTRGRPWVRMKTAASLDGRTVALMDIGKSRGKEFIDRLEGHFRAAGIATPVRTAATVKAVREGTFM